VGQGAAEHPDRRRAGHPVALDIPALAGQQVVASGGEGGDVGHLAAGHHGEGGRRGQAEEVEEPGAHRLLDDRGGRADGVQPGVLVPGRGQPVSGDGDGQGRADHEAEEAGRSGGDEPALDGGQQLVEDRRRAERTVGQPLGQAVGERAVVRRRDGRRTDRALTDRAQVAGGLLGHAVQQRRVLVHGRTIAGTRVTARVHGRSAARATSGDALTKSRTPP
jgi:hypothetical protein